MRNRTPEIQARKATTQAELTKLQFCPLPDTSDLLPEPDVSDLLPEDDWTVTVYCEPEHYDDVGIAFMVAPFEDR